MRGTGIRNRRGQSIIEYLVVAAAIIGAIMVFGPAIGGQVSNIGNNAVTQTGSSAGAVSGRVTSGQR